MSVVSIASISTKVSRGSQKDMQIFVLGLFAVDIMVLYVVTDTNDTAKPSVVNYEIVVFT